VRQNPAGVVGLLEVWRPKLDVDLRRLLGTARRGDQPAGRRVPPHTEALVMAVTRPVLRVKRTELDSCACGQPKRLDDRMCMTCLVRSAQLETAADRREDRKRARAVPGMPALKGVGLTVKDAATDEVKYTVPQRIATDRARAVIRNTNVQVWTGKPRKPTAS
jgi:hypothetical protein